MNVRGGGHDHAIKECRNISRMQPENLTNKEKQLPNTLKEGSHVDNESILGRRAVSYWHFNLIIYLTQNLKTIFLSPLKTERDLS